MIKILFKKIFLLLLFSFLEQSVSAQFQPPFTISNNTEQIESPLILESADLDGDGDVDFVLLDDVYKSVAWYENLDGKGRLDDPKYIEGLNSPSYITLTDIDNDGILDILGSNDEDLVWIKNNLSTNGTFSSTNYINQGDNVSEREVELEDVNGDGIKDLISVGFNNSISWYEGIDGNGNFQSIAELIENGKNLIEFADLDNDGDLDIVSTSDSLTSLGLVWFENIDGNGNFSVPLVINPVIPAIDDIQIADLDADGDMDVLLGLGNGTNSHLIYDWYENKINDNEAWVKKDISLTEKIAPPVIYDIDNDGDLDLITSREGLRIYENINGLGDFIPGEVLSIFDSFSLSNPDVNNDNIPDIVGIHKDAFFFESGLLYFGRSNQTFENPIDFIGDADLFPLNGGFIEGRDLTGDGVAELVISHRIMDRFSWQSFDNSELKFSNPKVIDDVRATDIAYSDINQDGLEDLVVLTTEPEFEVIWYEKIEEENNFELGKVLFSDEQGNGKIFVNDLDSDGDPDILINRNGLFDQGVYWLENLNGQGSFSSLQTINPSSFEGLLLEDVDLDGDLDIFYYDRPGNNFSWMENENGTFFNSVTLVLVADQENFLLSDLDGNGWNDLIYFTEDSKVNIRKSNGEVGNYSELITFLVPHDFNSETQFFLRDFDLDGDSDLLIAEIVFDESFLHTYEFIGGSNLFSSIPVSYELPASTIQVSVDDYDGDLDLDLVIHNDNDKELQFIENLFSEIKINGKVFLDVNGNTSMDVGEPLIFPNSINLEPGANFTYPSDIGYFNYVVDEGEYNLSCSVPSNFIFTTPSTISIIVNDSLNAQVCFGVMPEREEAAIKTNIISAPTRCGFEVPFWLSYQNTGSVVGDLKITLTADPRVSFISSSQEPDSIVGDQYFWSHENLVPTHSGQIQVLFKMPGVESIEEFLSFNQTTTIQSQDGIFYASNGIGYRPQINCAYDPNDKLVEPNIPGFNNFTLFNDTLDYIVRFQNTGTDTAFTVVIEDYLDSNLDYSSLDVLSASHAYRAMLDQETGELLFTFENILLPDSTTNEVESHGFVRYRILPKDELLENTIISNFANIYFDFNPPIITNTVENIFVSDVPLFIATDDPDCFEGVDGSIFILYDSPFYDSISWSTGNTGLIETGLSEGIYDLTIFYLDGTQIDTSFILTQPDPIELTISTSPDINASSNGEIMVEPSNGQSPYNYSWSHDSDLFEDTAMDLPAGDYTVTVTDVKGCSQIETIPVDQITNTKNLISSNHLIVRPNPNNGSFKVDLTFQNSANWEVKITNALGQLVEGKTAPENGSRTSKIDFELTRGVYWVSLFVDGKLIEKKTVVVE